MSHSDMMEQPGMETGGQCASAPVLPIPPPLLQPETGLSLKLRLRGPALSPGMLSIGHWEDQPHFSRTGIPSTARQLLTEGPEPRIGTELGRSLVLPGHPLMLGSIRKSWSQ